jgi:hypothetical protein
MCVLDGIGRLNFSQSPAIHDDQDCFVAHTVKLQHFACESLVNNPAGFSRIPLTLTIYCPGSQNWHVFGIIGGKGNRPI